MRLVGVVVLVLLSVSLVQGVIQVRQTGTSCLVCATHRESTATSLFR
jgi:hypothetical protein